MKTNCYCVLCPKHPLYPKRAEIKSEQLVTGFDVGDHVYDEAQRATGAEVDCLAPSSEAFVDLDIDPEYHEFPITAYGDGSSVTGFQGRGYVITAFCDEEEYREGDFVGEQK